MAELKDLLEIEQREDIAIIWLDNKLESINKISPEMIGYFEECYNQIETDGNIKGVVIASRKKDFIAGADIEYFQTITEKGQFTPFSRKGHELLGRLASANKPVVAAISGSCVGAGTEIALACTARVASDSSSTYLALPEVMLGLLPGGGGCTRLPRLIGIQRALPILMTGKKTYARPARKIGLVDKVVPEGTLINAAIHTARSLMKAPIKRKDNRTFVEKLLESNGIGRGIIFKQARKMVMGQTKGNYPAPLKILEVVEAGYKKGFAAGIEAEIEEFENLLLTPECHALTHLFFAMTAKKKNPYAEEHIRPMRTIGMLGAGFMGAGIAEVSIDKGMDVLLKDIKEETLVSAKKSIWKTLAKKAKRKTISKVEANSLIDKVHTQLDWDGYEHVDCVIEAVFEDLELKKKIIQETEANTREDCIFASNTSALPIGHIAAASSRPETVIGMHYFSPVPKMPLLEIVVTPQTADWVTASCFEIGIRQGKTCIVVKDGPGFYTTRILAPLLNEALLLLEEGADALQIDRELKKFGFPVGPITLIDEVGIDVGAHIMEGDLMKAAMERPGFKASTALQKMAEKGYKGRKNKKGFLKYDDKGKKVRNQLDPELYSFFGGNSRKQMEAEVLQFRISTAMIKEALVCMEDGIILDAVDGDVGAVFGLGFPPFTGGPFRYIDQIGAKTMVDRMNQLEQQFGERFSPPAILKQKADAGEKFHN